MRFLFLLDAMVTAKTCSWMVLTPVGLRTNIFYLERPSMLVVSSSWKDDVLAKRTRQFVGSRNNRLTVRLEAKLDGTPGFGSGGTDSQEGSPGGQEENAFGASTAGGQLESKKSVWSKYSAQSEELTQRLRRYGSAGVLAYGLFNTVYYLGAFLFVWFFVTPSPGGLGFRQAAQRFFKVFAMVWAGSQVTKLLRAGGALALAPAVDAGLTWFTSRFNVQSRGKAFGIVVGGCVFLAVVVFVLITSLWA